MKLKGYLLAVTTAVTFGLIPLFMIPLKLTGLALDTILFYRFLIASVFILGYLLYTRESLKTSKKECLIFALLGLLYASSSEFLFTGYDYLSAGIASTILFTYPVIVALVLALFFKEKVSKTVGISLLITLSGVFALSVKDSTFDINFIGLFICLLSAFLYAIYIVVVNKSSAKASGAKVSFYSLLLSSVFYLIKGLATRESFELQSGEIFFDITIFSLVTTVLSVLSLVYAIKYIGSTPTSIIGALEPVVAVFISVVFFQEQLTFPLIIGIMLILAGVTINVISEGMKVSKGKKLKNTHL
ncbi:DMT family transporter [Sinomicrobium sp.]